MVCRPCGVQASLYSVPGALPQTLICHPSEFRKHLGLDSQSLIIITLGTELPSRAFETVIETPNVSVYFAKIS